MRRSKRHANDAFRSSETLLGSRIPLLSLIQTLAVAEYLNFRHAANALGVAQSSVSARVKALEEDLGILLFERRARGVRLTEAGRHFVERIAAGVDQLDHAVKTAGMAATGEWGRLRIGVHALIPRSFLADLIGQYRENHPGIEVEITEGTARDAVMQLRADRLDVAFVAGTPELPDCHTRPVWTESLVAVLPDRHRLAGQPAITWADLVGETFLVRYGGTGPQVHDHIVLRLAGRWPAPSILRFDVGRGSQRYGIARQQLIV
jgi:DNA-binding transcriptional LysR family regulator